MRWNQSVEHATGNGKEPHPSTLKHGTELRHPTEFSTRSRLDHFARARLSLSSKVHGPFDREVVEQQVRHNPQRIDVTMEAGAHFVVTPDTKTGATT